MYQRSSLGLLLLVGLVGIQLLGQPVQCIDRSDISADQEDMFDHGETFFDSQREFDEEQKMEGQSATPSLGRREVHVNGPEDQFYDPGSDFFDEADENVCATSAKHECQSCCRTKRFDLPYWNGTTSQCFCYESDGEANICKDAKETGACGLCCSGKGYKDADFLGNPGEENCFCSKPDFEKFRRSFAGPE